MKRFLSLLLVMSILLCYPVAAMARTTGEFADIKGHWAEQQIQACAQLDLMHGIGVNQAGEMLFAPDALVSNAQAAVVLQQTFELDYGDIRFIKQPLASDYFGDVENDAWYSGALVMCAINKVFDSKTHFGPASEISRIELAQAVYRSFQARHISIPMIMSMPVFNDTQNLNQEETNAMVFVNNTGIMTGNNGSFRPADPLRRSELACVLNRITMLTSMDKNAQEIKVQSGKSFSLTLVSNPSTGYSWQLAEQYDKEILSLAGSAYLSQNTPNLAGQAGYQLFKFRALQNGQTEIKLVYSRPWESVQPIETLTIKVVTVD